MDGVTFVKELKILNRSIPNAKNVAIIMISTEGGEAKIQEAMNAGADSYIAKPFTPDTMKRKIDEILKFRGYI